MCGPRNPEAVSLLRSLIERLIVLQTVDTSSPPPCIECVFDFILRRTGENTLGGTGLPLGSKRPFRVTLGRRNGTTLVALPEPWDLTDELAYSFPTASLAGSTAASSTRGTTSCRRSATGSAFTEPEVAGPVLSAPGGTGPDVTGPVGKLLVTGKLVAVNERHALLLATTVCHRRPAGSLLPAQSLPEPVWLVVPTAMTRELR